MILPFLKKDPQRKNAEILYGRLVDQARMPEFYTDIGAPDTVEGRFELLVIHVFLVLRRLKVEKDQANQLAQKLFDTFFENMDGSLRELGVGDLSVAKRIRKMAEAFYGRSGRYEAALIANDAPALQAAISNNVYSATDAAGAAILSRYVLESDRMLASQSLSQLQSGVVNFAPVTASPAERLAVSQFE